MKALLLAALAATGIALPAAAAPISILAAENFYGEVARAIAGDRVTVESVIVAPGTIRMSSTRRLLWRATHPPPTSWMNGADYDPWMARLLDAQSVAGRTVIDVAALAGHKDGDNPHVWYDPKAMPAMANALTAELVSGPSHKAGFETRRDAFLATLTPIAEKVASLRAKYAGAPVVATEPVFGYMAEALGLKMQNQAFQTAIMNETEPAASDIAAMEDAIRGGHVKNSFL